MPVIYTYINACIFVCSIDLEEQEDNANRGRKKKQSPKVFVVCSTHALTKYIFRSVLQCIQRLASIYMYVAVRINNA